MKKMLIIIFIIYDIVKTVFKVATWPVRWIWKSINWKYRLVGTCALCIVICFETVTPAYWLSLAQYYEARDESWMGRYAVANVVLNRVEDRRWPNTIKEVINDGRERGRLCDFSFMCDGKKEDPWSHPSKFWGKWFRIKVESWIIVAAFDCFLIISMIDIIAYLTLGILRPGLWGSVCLFRQLDFIVEFNVVHSRK